MKQFAQKNCRQMFLEAIFFRIRENFFQSFRTKFLSLLYMISLAYKISHCLFANHYPELRCVVCTGVTLFALALHFLHWCYTFCTGVTLFALVLHFLHWCYTFCTGVILFALVLHFLHWCYTFCTGVILELHCSQPIRIEYFFHVYY